MYNSFIEIMKQWPNLGEFGRDIGVSQPHANCLKARDSIPAKYWMALIKAAKKRNVKGITHELLARLVCTKKQPKN